MSGTLRFGKVKHVALIGGGDVMVEAGDLLLKAGYVVTAIVAPRHVNARLPLRDKTLAQALKEVSIAAHVTDSVNSWETLAAVVPAGERSLALCFGPDWIFNAAVRAHFGAGMLNFNGIPVPRYLGGAHYSWQILNGDRSGGCVLQEITEAIDRGPLLRRELFEHAPDVRRPMDYYRSNFIKASTFLATVIADMRDDKPFALTRFEDLEGERLYLPRLLTSEQAYIDWTWDASGIERFCWAFDEPYAGAASFIGDQTLRLRSVCRDESLGTFHPFAAGLIVRKHKGSVWFAARGSALRADEIRTADGKDAAAFLREGQRLHTPASVLEKAHAARPAVTYASRARMDAVC